MRCRWQGLEAQRTIQGRFVAAEPLVTPLFLHTPAPMDDFARARKTPARQLLSWGLVVLLHLLIAWLIHSGLGRTVLEQLKKPVEVVLLQLDAPTPTPDLPSKPNETTPPPPKASTPPPPAPPAAPIDVPMAQVPQAPLAAPPATSPSTAVPPAAPAPSAPVVTQAAAPTPTPKAAAPSAPPAPLVRTAALVSAKHCKKPDYPKASLDLEEEGTVHLRFLLGVDGKVMRSDIEKSSGSRRLDEAARTGLSLCQFKAGTVDGKPEPTWVNIIYTWTLD
jgi:periplasmic protein TonB